MELFLGLLFLGAATLLMVFHVWLLHEDKKPGPERFRGFGTIDMRCDNDRGIPWFYVTFMHNGEVLRGKTYLYHWEEIGRVVNPGDKFEIEYYFNGDTPRVLLLGDGIANNEPGPYKFYLPLYISIPFYIASILLLVFGVFGG